MNTTRESSKDWDSKYVRAKYGHEVNGCDFIYYPCRSPKRLVVNFSSMGKDRFDRYSRYWDVSELWEADTAYLFFKDDSFKYFLGSEEDPKDNIYYRLIRDFIAINSLSSESVFTVGGSMGGYAAIFYALSLRLGGCIVAAPQIDKQSMVAHKYVNWTKNSNQTGANWKDLDIYSLGFDKLPYLYIEYGNYFSDVLAAEKIVTSFKKKKSLTIVRKAVWAEHTVSSVLSKEVVDSVINFFEFNKTVENIY